VGILTKKKSFDYFDAFLKIAGEGSAAARYLHESLTEFNYAAVPARTKAMHDIENAADSSKHVIIEHLAHEFITPIEREDIVALAQALDTVVDAIDDVMRRVYMFNIRAIRPETLEFTQHIVHACDLLETAVAEFRNFKDSKTIKRSIIEVNTEENCGDALHSEYLHKLFSEETDSKTTLVWMTMFESLEQCFDACEDAADIIESVIMKNT